jgi:predicted nucleotidyltransferase
MGRLPTTRSLPIGTQVVALTPGKGPRGDEICHQGSVGVVIGPVEKPPDSYQVRLADGSIVIFPRESLAIRKHFQLDSAHRGRTQDAQPDLNEYIIYRCVVGSRAFGLAEDASDFDRRGIFLPPAHLQWSLFGLPEQIENQETQECYWEIEKFLLLALKANPNILECLYTPSVELATPLAEELLSMRSIFLSQLIYQTYNGYVMSQFKKLSGDLRNKGAIRWKHAMHLIRLLVSGITILREGFVPLRIEEHRDRLLEIRRGNVAWEDINAWRLRLHKEFDTAFAATRLPEYPDYERANEFLLKARRSMVTKDS